MQKTKENPKNKKNFEKTTKMTNSKTKKLLDDQNNEPNNNQDSY